MKSKGDDVPMQRNGPLGGMKRRGRGNGRQPVWFRAFVNGRAERNARFAKDAGEIAEMDEDTVPASVVCVKKTCCGFGPSAP